MCALFGIAGAGIINDDLKVLRELLYVSGLRGMDSTGLVCVNTLNQKNQNIKLKKLASPPMMFMYDDLNSKKPLLKSFISDLFLGHCRDATVGKVNKENAHPFEIGKYIAAHNGTLDDAKYRKYSEGKTDSQLLFEDMEERGIEKPIEEISLSSAFALSIYNKSTRELTFVRNGKRSLYYTSANDRSVIYWSSEQEMLELVLARNNVSYDNIYYFEPYKTYTIKTSDIRKKKISWRTKELTPNPVEKSVTSRIWYPTAPWQGGQYWWEDPACAYCQTPVTDKEVKDGTAMIVNCNDGSHYHVCPDCKIKCDEHDEKKKQEELLLESKEVILH